MEKDYPIKIVSSYPERSSRLLGLLGVLLYIPKMIILVPHLIIVGVLSYVLLIVNWIAQWAILFTGKHPRGMHKFTMGFLQWALRMQSYMYGLTDVYPPFSLEYTYQATEAPKYQEGSNEEAV